VALDPTLARPARTAPVGPPPAAPADPLAGAAQQAGDQPAAPANQSTPPANTPPAK
jgi:hypothetical protein